MEKARNKRMHLKEMHDRYATWKWLMPLKFEQKIISLYLLNGIARNLCLRMWPYGFQENSLEDIEIKQISHLWF